MFWLGLGAALLLWCAITKQHKPRFDVVSAVAAGCFCWGIIASVSIYPGGGVAVICVVASIAASGLTLICPSASLPTRLTAMCLGAMATLFALFGPAKGVF